MSLRAGQSSTVSKRRRRIGEPALTLLKLPERGLSFKARVYALTGQIPRGRVSTYGAIARALGRPRAARAVGTVLRLNPTPIVVPCHRVVHSDGRLGGYGGSAGQPKKVALLTTEGVNIENGRIDRLSQVRFDEFS